MVENCSIVGQSESLCESHSVCGFILETVMDVNCCVLIEAYAPRCYKALRPLQKKLPLFRKRKKKKKGNIRVLKVS